MTLVFYRVLAVQTNKEREHVCEGMNDGLVHSH
jgi:hypothetical protein